MMKIKKKTITCLLFLLIVGIALSKSKNSEEDDLDDDYEKQKNSIGSRLNVTTKFQIDDITNEKDVSLTISHKYKLLSSSVTIGDQQIIRNETLHNKYYINLDFSFYIFNFNKMFGEKPEGNEVLADRENKIN